MTNEELFDDLKQLITAQNSQLEERLSVRIDGLDQRIDGLDQRVDGLGQRVDNLDRRIDGLDQAVRSGFETVDVKLNEIQNAIGKELDAADAKWDDHEQRLRKLEHRTA